VSERRGHPTNRGWSRCVCFPWILNFATVNVNYFVTALWRNTWKRFGESMQAIIEVRGWHNVYSNCGYSNKRNYRNSKELVKFGKNAQKSTKVKDRRKTWWFLTKAESRKQKAYYIEYTGRMSGFCAPRFRGNSAKPTASGPPAMVRVRTRYHIHVWYKLAISKDWSHVSNNLHNEQIRTDIGLGVANIQRVHQNWDPFSKIF
jgi:hypothetical protein